MSDDRRVRVRVNVDLVLTDDCQVDLTNEQLSKQCTEDLRAQLFEDYELDSDSINVEQFTVSVELEDA